MPSGHMRPLPQAPRLLDPERLRMQHLLLAILVSSATAQASPPAVQITVSSGGVSLGSYQSGYLLARQETDTNQADVRILTGASAGAINSVAGLYYAFHAGKDYDPFAEWLGIGWKELVTGPDGSVLRDKSLFTTRRIEQALDNVIDHMLQPPDPGLPLPPVVYLGFAVSRFLPPEIESPKLSVRKADLKFVVGARWEPSCSDATRKGGCYRFWSEPLTDVHWKSGQPILWFGEHGTDHEQIRTSLKNLALASSAFPIAFPPRKLQVFATRNCYDVAALKCLNSGTCHASKDTGQEREAIRIRGIEGGTMGEVASRFRTCDTLSADSPLESSLEVSLLEMKDSSWGRWGKDSVKFSDGGIFDNQPLELALRIYATGLGRQPSPYAPGLVPHDLPLGPLGSVRLTIPTHYVTDQPDAQEKRGMVDEWIRYLMDRRPDPSELELARASENSHLQHSRTEVNTTSMPLASEHFMHFSGFFEPAFRRFDFLVGYLDGMRQAHRSPLQPGDLLPKESSAHHEPWLDRLLRTDPILRIYREHERYWARDRNAVDSANAFLDSLDRSIDLTLDTLTNASGNQDAIEVLRVLKGSVNRLRGTNASLAEDSREDDGDRFANFQAPLPWHYRGYADTFYFQAARMIGHDALGQGSSLLYPLAFHAGRIGLAGAFGEKPAWSAPYLKLGFSSTGFEAMQGLTLPKDWLAQLHAPVRWLLTRERFEAGIRISKAGSADVVDADWKGHLALRTQFEIQAGSMLSLLPGITKTAPFFYGQAADKELVARPTVGLGILIADHLHLRIDCPQLWGNFDRHVFDDPRLSGGIQAGFNLYAVSEGLRNGTLKQRRKP